jgi:hypothetical protein
MPANPAAAALPETSNIYMNIVGFLFNFIF